MHTPLTVADVAKRMKLSAYTVRLYARQGRFPGAIQLCEDGPWRFPDPCAYVAPKRAPKVTPDLAVVSLAERRVRFKNWRSA
ncbi:MAG TPA: helix-turn-helix domain-containing protein [Allosphingosinicella sp.]|nr:hypothetical protein [Gemmatimonadaceae bacterium]